MYYKYGPKPLLSFLVRGRRTPNTPTMIVRCRSSAHLVSSSHRPSKTDAATSSTSPPSSHDDSIRLSKLMAESMGTSRRHAERWIRSGQVTLAGVVVRTPAAVVRREDVTHGNALLQVEGKPVPVWKVLFDKTENASSKTSSTTNKETTDRVWLVHKLRGELVADFDPQNRPCLMDRLRRDGLNRRNGSRRYHWKPIGRLDMNTEGLVVLSACGDYSRNMELPRHRVHRTYRVRAHGIVTQHKLERIKKGMVIDGVRYAPMWIEADTKPRQRQDSTNSWLKVTCCEGKNRMIRNVFRHLGLTVTRLIRVSYGDYDLKDIPPGMAMPVALKPIEQQKRRGPLFRRK